MNCEITPEKIRALIKSELRLADVPMNESFHNLGFKSGDLTRIQVRIAKAFNRSVRTVFFSDTVYTIADQLTFKPNTHGRIQH